MSPHIAYIERLEAANLHMIRGLAAILGQVELATKFSEPVDADKVRKLVTDALPAYAQPRVPTNPATLISTGQLGGSGD